MFILGTPMESIEGRKLVVYTPIPGADQIYDHQRQGLQGRHRHFVQLAASQPP